MYGCPLAWESPLRNFANCEHWVFAKCEHLIWCSQWQNYAAPTKTLAKLANHAAKHMKANGVAVLDTPSKWQWLQKRLPVQKIWGVGQKLTQRLNAIGIQSAYDLAQSQPKNIRRFTSINMERTIAELNGELCFGIEEYASDKKEIFVTRSFGTKTNSKEELLQHISRYAVAACEKMRLQKGVTQHMMVFARSSAFKDNYYSKSTTHSLPHITQDTRLIVQAAKMVMSRLYKEGVLFAQCGIGLLDVRSSQFHQSDLFTKGDTHHADSLMQTLDTVNQRFGRDSLVLGAEGLRSGKWSMNQQLLSPAYTSSWAELPVVGG